MAIHSPALDPAQPTGLLLDGIFDPRDEDLAVVNPYDGQTIATVATGGPADVDAAATGARAHLGAHPAVARAEVLERAARLVAERAETFARTICLEAGKPLKQARAETARCVDTLTFSAVEARTLTGEMVAMDASSAGAGKLGMILREPIGVVGAISPFNFPLNLVAHKVAPAIAAGCPVVLKPASATPLSALLLARALADAGLPPGFLSVIPGGGGTVGNAIVDHAGVAMISFTGSPPVGWGIRQRQPHKEVALELGNSTPVIVEADADLETAAAQARRIRLHARRAVVHLGAARLRAGRRARPLPRSVHRRRGRGWWSATRWTRPPTSARSSTAATATGSRSGSTRPPAAARASSRAARCARGC